MFAYYRFLLISQIATPNILDLNDNRTIRNR